MAKGKQADMIRLREIVATLVEPFQEFDWLNTENKLHFAMGNPDERPIYRRRILMPMKVHGLWWLHESQWTRFLSPIHGNSQVIKSGEDPDRVLASRILDKGWCYVREVGDRIDIEAIGKTKKWDPVKKKSKGTAYEWLTVSITREKYLALDNFFGEVHSGCRHDYNQGCSDDADDLQCK